MSRALVGLGLGGVVLEAGCAWIWAMSPQLTALYTPAFTAAFFERIPGARRLDRGILDLLGPLGKGAQDVPGMVLQLEIGLMLATIGYVAALVVLRHAGRSAWVLVLGFALLFRVTFLLLPGMFSTDVFSYVMYGRIAAIHGQNPYLLPPSTFGSDPFLAWVFPFWRDQPSVYGPLWADFSWLLTRTSTNLSNFDQVLLYRLSLGAIELATLGWLGWLVRRLQPVDGSRSPYAPTMAFALYAWNPLVLFDLVGGTHNDVAMLALLLVGTASITSRSGGHWLWGLAALTLGALVKYATGIVVLLWVVAWAARAETVRQRLRRLAGGLALPLALAVVVWWPWLPTSQALTPLGEAAGGRLVLNSAPDLLALTVADQVLEPAGMPPEDAQMSARFWTRAISRALFGFYLVSETCRLWSTRGELRSMLEASTRALLILPLLVITWVWSWYFSWSLVLAALLGWRSMLTRVVVAYTLTALPVVYAHLYLNEQLSGLFVVLFAVAPLLLLVLDRNWRSKSPR